MGKLHSRITVTLPTFIIIALRHLVKAANDKRRDGDKWTVSSLLEAWLLQVLTTKELNEVAKASPEFKAAAEAWIRSLAKNG